MTTRARNAVIAAFLVAAIGLLPSVRSAHATTTTSIVPPRFQTFAVPSTIGASAGEPSIGVDWNTGRVFYQAGLTTLQVNFDDTTSPAQATWNNVSSVLASKVSLDAILFTDHYTGRTQVSQLSGTTSLSEVTDNDGLSWTPSQGGGIASGVDHQTLGAGPYSATTPLSAIGSPVYPDAVYYCSQDIGDAACALSTDGGITFGQATPIWTLNDCGGLHGHVKVGPDGTAYVPNRDCGGLGDFQVAQPTGPQGLAVSTDDGQTWTVRHVTGSKAGNTDPSVGVASDGTLYFGYQACTYDTSGFCIQSQPRIAVSHDKGQTWQYDTNVGATFGINNAVFPEVVAGDGNRAAFAFLGTPSSGNYNSQPTFNGIWHLYIATTYDGGQHWTTVDATPNDPVQRGSICDGGTGCSNTPDDRNLLDFMDITIDKTGRVLVGYPDGCVGKCVNPTSTPAPTATQSSQSRLNSFTAYATIARQSGGLSLFSKYDTPQPSAPARPGLTATESSAAGPVHLSWLAPDNGGSPITGYRLYRGTAPGKETLFSSVSGTTLSYTDSTVKSGTTYYYKLQALNKYGASALSPEVTPVVVNPKPMCTLPGQTVLVDNAGDQAAAPTNSDLDILSVSIAEPAGTSNLVVTMKVSNLQNMGANHQWRVFWDDPANPGDRWYVGMDTDATGAPTFIYGDNFGVTSPVKYAPGVPTSTTNALSQSKIDTANGTITVVVPKSGVGSPSPSSTSYSTLNNIQGRTFAGQGDVTVSTQGAIDTTGFATYTVVGNAYCQ